MFRLKHKPRRASRFQVTINSLRYVSCWSKVKLFIRTCVDINCGEARKSPVDRRCELGRAVNRHSCNGFLVSVSLQNPVGGRNELASSRATAALVTYFLQRVFFPPTHYRVKWSFWHKQYAMWNDSSSFVVSCCATKFHLLQLVWENLSGNLFCKYDSIFSSIVRRIVDENWLKTLQYFS